MAYNKINNYKQKQVCSFKKYTQYLKYNMATKHNNQQPKEDSIQLDPNAYVSSIILFCF